MFAKHLRHMPTSVVVLGVVSLLMDLSSEMIHVLLPLFMVNQLGLSLLTVGMLDGFAEALTLWCKPISGWLSDHTRQRKPLTVLGYGLAALSKPLFALSYGLVLLTTARVIDRVGKGIRGAPRDALIADITPPPMRGAAYGLRQSMDTLGALTAPLLASLLLWTFTSDIRLIFWIACVPAVLAVITLMVGVKEPSVSSANASPPKTPATQRIRDLWPLFLLAFLLMLARPSEAFLILRAQDIGLPVASAPLVMAMMNFIYAASAWPFGIWFDRIGERLLLPLAMGFLIAALVVLSVAETPLAIFIGAICWGLHLGCSQGLLAALIAHHAPSAKRGRSFGVYALCIGIALLINGAIFGALWQHQSAAFAFACSAALALTALAATPTLLARIRRV